MVIRSIENEDIENLNKVILNIKYGDFEIFPENWKCLILENVPILDEDTFPLFIKALENINSNEFYIYPPKPKVGDDLFAFKTSVDWKEFSAHNSDCYFFATGGLIMDEKQKIAAFAEADNSILFLGFEKGVEDLLLPIFSNSQFILTKEAAKRIYYNN